MQVNTTLTIVRESFGRMLVSMCLRKLDYTTQVSRSPFGHGFIKSPPQIKCEYAEDKV